MKILCLFEITGSSNTQPFTDMVVAYTLGQAKGLTEKAHTVPAGILIIETAVPLGYAGSTLDQPQILTTSQPCSPNTRKPCWN